MSTYDFMETFEKSQQEAMQRNAAQAQKAAVAGLRPTSEGTPLTKAQEKLGRATYSWARPEYLATPFETYNAKNLPYAGAYGVGLANYGWNEENILDKIDFSRDMYQKDDKSGGYRQIYRGMREWGNKYNPKVTQLLETGKVPEGLDMDSVLHAADYGLRSLGQHQQNKKSFLNSPLGSIVKTGLTIGSAFVPVVGPALAVGVGGGLGSMSGGGLKGALMGAASGYMAGSLPATYGSGFTGMANMGKGIMSIPMNTARYLGNIGSSFGNLATGGLQGLQHNLGNFGRAIFQPSMASNLPFRTSIGGLSNVAPSPFLGMTSAPYTGASYSTRLFQPRTVGGTPLAGSVTGGGLGGFAGDVGKQLAMNYAINALTPEPEPQYLDPYAGLYGSQGLMDLVTDDIYYDEDNPYENPEIDSYEDFQYYA
jgi:hypothetical protein